MRYYWCVNCGDSHDFGKDKVRGTNCVNCGYEDVCELDEEEWEEEKKKTANVDKVETKNADIDELLKSIKEGTYVNSNG